jgi:hypothetical protein
MKVFIVFDAENETQPFSVLITYTCDKTDPTGTAVKEQVDGYLKTLNLAVKDTP